MTTITRPNVVEVYDVVAFASGRAGHLEQTSEAVRDTFVFRDEAEEAVETLREEEGVDGQRYSRRFSINPRLVREDELQRHVPEEEYGKYLSAHGADVEADADIEFVRNVLEDYTGKAEMEGETVFETDIGDAIGIAYARIQESDPHYHEETTEYYFSTDGAATIHVDGESLELEERSALKIPPGVDHYVDGDDYGVWVVSVPAWRPEDHHLLEDSVP